MKFNRIVANWSVYLGGICYAVWPTSAPFLLNGLPFNTKFEFLCFLCASIVLLITGFARLFEKCGYIGIPTLYDDCFRFKAIIGIVTLLLLGTLVWIKSETPVKDGIQSCLIVPHLSATKCAFSADSPWSLSTTISRSPSNLTFGGDRGWAIGAFNTKRFFSIREGMSAYNTRPASPFKFQVAVGKNIANIVNNSSGYSDLFTIPVKYRGGLWIESSQENEGPEHVFPFSKDISTAFIQLSKNELYKTIFTYVNYVCNRDEFHFVVGEIRKNQVTGKHVFDENCIAQVSEFLYHTNPDDWDIKTINDRQASLQIMFLPPGSKTTFIDVDGMYSLGDHLFSLSTIVEKIMFITFILFILCPSLFRYIRYFRRVWTSVSLSKTTNGFLVNCSSGIYRSLPLYYSMFVNWLKSEKLVLTVLFLLIVTSVASAYAYFYYSKIYGIRFADLWWQPNLTYMWNSYFVIFLSLLILFPRLRFSTHLFAVKLRRDAYYILLSPALLYLFLILIRVTPQYDDIIWLTPGNDALTWSAYGRDLIQNRTIWLESTSMISKPLFIYFRAMCFVLFGDGELYYRNFTVGIRLMAFTIIFCNLAVVFLTHQNTNTLNGSSDRFRLLIVGLLYLGYTYFGTSWLGVSTVLTSGLLSEGLSWTAGLLSITLLVILVFSINISSHNEKIHSVLFITGCVFAISAMARTQQLPFLLSLLCILSLFCKKPYYFRSAYRLCLPIIVGIVVIVFLALLHPRGFSHAIDHVLYSTSVTLDLNFFQMFAEGVPRLVPAPTELICLIWFFVVSIMCMLRRIKLDYGLNYHRIILSETLIMVGILLSTVLFQLPLISKMGYYPRPIIFSYHLLASLSMVQLLRLTLMETSPQSLPSKA